MQHSCRSFPLHIYGRDRYKGWGRGGRGVEESCFVNFCVVNSDALISLSGMTTINISKPVFFFFSVSSTRQSLRVSYSSAQPQIPHQRLGTVCVKHGSSTSIGCVLSCVVVPKGLLTFLGSLYEEIAKTTFGTLVYRFERQTARKKKKKKSYLEKHCVVDLECRILSQEPSDSCILYFDVIFYGK